MDTRIVRVRSLRGGHYRAGRYFGPDKVNIEARVLSRRELAAIEADPDLSVEIISEDKT